MRRLLTLVVPALALTAGCTHHPNVARSDALSTADADVFVSSAYYDDGAMRHAVVERVSGTERGCEGGEITRYDYDRQGDLVRRVSEQRDCGAVTVRVVDTFDAADGTRLREVFRDLDVDGSFDDQVRWREPVAKAPAAPTADEIARLAAR